ncbi:MAG: response regulator [Pelovirga sp.]
MPKVLLVDDVELFLELERSYLSGCGYDVSTAASGEEALSRLDKVVPDVLLLDFYMPGINGDEVCRVIRRNPRWQDLPILMVTAAGKTEEVQRCLDAGCSDYLTKPINKTELREKVARLLQHTSAVAEATASSPAARHHGGVTPAPAARQRQDSTIKVAIRLPDGEALSLSGVIQRTTGDHSSGQNYLLEPDQRSQALLKGLAARETGAGRSQAGLSERLRALEQEYTRLREEQDEAIRRISELEQENHEFANQLVQVEEVNNNLTNLYLASSRLHSTLDRQETLEIIKEVVINFVGAEKFAVFLLDPQSNKLAYETGEGFDDAEQATPLDAGRGVFAEVVSEAENYFCSGPVGAGSDDLYAPIVAIPLKHYQQLIGVLAVYRLFIQKEQLVSIDYQLFSMLGEHAATALFSSSLYAKSERRRQAYQGFVDLLIK